MVIKEEETCEAKAFQKAKEDLRRKEQARKTGRQRRITEQKTEKKLRF